MNDPSKTRSKVSVVFRCIFAFIGLRCVFGFLTFALTLVMDSKDRAFAYVTLFLTLAFGIGLAYLVSHFSGEFGHPILPKWKWKVIAGIGIGAGTAIYYGYSWLLAVCILPAWYFLWYRRPVIK